MDDWYGGDPLGFPSFPIWHEDDMIMGASRGAKRLLIWQDRL